MLAEDHGGHFLDVLHLNLKERRQPLWPCRLRLAANYTLPDAVRKVSQLRFAECLQELQRLFARDLLKAGGESLERLLPFAKPCEDMIERNSTVPGRCHAWGDNGLGTEEPLEARS